jgi:hypothetical protein
MNDKRTEISSIKKGSDWKRLLSQSDSHVRQAIEADPEARPTDPDFWKKARVVMPKAKS